ncbi:MAG: hypothetical protein COB85_00835 [Bacteroidetes bacterium]|nr:MAG: hypothetical protein COB85_00835 [Bacteroidota bacterium]
MKYFAIFYLIIALLGSKAIAQTQADLDNFNYEREKIGGNSMFILGGWSVANIIVSGAALTDTKGEAYYFHEMNVMWNIINLGIAIPGYIGTKKRRNSVLSTSETVKKQMGTEKLYLINGILDVSYIFMGYYFYSLGDKYPKGANVLRGYGHSFMMQGTFLLLNDLAIAVIHGAHHKKKLAPILENLRFSGTSLGLVLPIK